MKLLLKGGADVDIRDKCKLTALHEAAGIGNLDITELFRGHSTDVDSDCWGDKEHYDSIKSTL